MSPVTAFFSLGFSENCFEYKRYCSLNSFIFSRSEDLTPRQRSEFLKMMTTVVKEKNELGRARFSMRDAG